MMKKMATSLKIDQKKKKKKKKKQMQQIEKVHHYI